MRISTVFSTTNRRVVSTCVAGWMVGILGGCGFLSDKGPEEEYRNAPVGRSLELPPELGAGKIREPRIKVPASKVAPEAECEPCIAAAIGSADASLTRVLPVSSKARFVRSGELAWLEIEQTPELSWQLLQRYVQASGYDIVTENPTEGIIDTDWVAINDSNAPGGLPLTETLSVADELGRYRFGFRLERTPRDTSRVFVRHEALLKRADADELAINDSELSNRLLMDLRGHVEGRRTPKRISN